MRPVLLLLPSLLGLIFLAACDQTGQQQAAEGAIQLPGERAAPDHRLNVPPDAWSGPGRPAFASSR